MPSRSPPLIRDGAVGLFRLDRAVIDLLKRDSSAAGQVGRPSGDPNAPLVDDSQVIGHLPARHQDVVVLGPQVASGPLGVPPKPESDPVDIPALVARTRAREHRVFTGRLDTNRLGLGERIVVKGVRAAEGDFRPWDEIRAWAREIAVALVPVAAGG